MSAGYYGPFRRAGRALRQLLYPRRCLFCNEVLGLRPVCPRCAAAVEALRRGPVQRLDPRRHYLGRLEGAAAPYRYTGCVRRAVLRAKYQGAPWVAVELGACMAQQLLGTGLRMEWADPVPMPSETARAFGMSYDCIVPVPPSGRARGYNVPTLMAQPLARACGLPVLPNALRRVRAGRHQAGLPMDERFANVAGAFRATGLHLVEGKRVLLVDDVITTGATAAACAQALLDAGAQSVFAFAAAAVELDDPPDETGPLCEDDPAEDEDELF